MSNMNQIASDLYKFLTESDSKKPKSYDTKAEVIRVEGKIAWVKIPGGEDETPVSLTTNAKPGDQVVARISGGRAWLLGNQTNPPTDDTVANVAVEQSNDAIEAAKVSQAAAEIAGEAANNAINGADRAKDAADTADSMARAAIDSATRAENYAATAQTQAAFAIESASLANESANAATFKLDEVEKVLDVLNWVSSHGTYALTADETVVPGKWYFEKVNDSYLVTTPASNPRQEGLYELSNVDAAVSEYIITHLYLDNSGLHVKLDNSGAQLLISSTGIYIINSNGETIASYTGSIVLGPDNGTHIEITPTYGVSFYQTTKIEESGVPMNRIAYIQSDRLFIQSATLTNNLQIGNFRWVVLDHRISLKYNPLT